LAFGKEYSQPALSLGAAGFPRFLAAPIHLTETIATIDFYFYFPVRMPGKQFHRLD